MDESINKRRWAVTYDSMKRQASTFVGKPAVMIPSLEHPPTEIQEAYKVGNISSISLHENRKSCSAIISLTADAASLVSRRKVFHTSVQLSASERGLRTINKGTPFEYDLCDEWIGQHVALVGSPAYGKDKAVIKRVCQGTAVKCVAELPKEADANDSNIEQITVVPFVKQSLERLYKPCTLERVVAEAPAWNEVGKVAYKYPDLSAVEVIAMAIAICPDFGKRMDAEISHHVTAAMRK